MKTNLFFLAFMLLTIPSLCQEKNFKYRGDVNYGYMMGISNYNLLTGEPNGGTITVNEEIFGHSLRTQHGLVYKDKLFMGLGIGLENYTYKESSFASFNALPLFFNTKFYFSKKRNTFYTGISVGHTIRIKGGGSVPGEWNGGIMINPEIGFKFKISRALDIMMSLNYVHQNISTPDTFGGMDFLQKPQYRSAHVRVGIVF